MILAVYHEHRALTQTLKGKLNCYNCLYSFLLGISPGLDDLEVKFTVHVMFHHDDRFPVNFTLQGRLTQDALNEWNYNAEMTPQGKFGHFKLQQSMYNSHTARLSKKARISQFQSVFIDNRLI